MPLTPGQTTLATIRTLVRQRADMVNSLFVTDAELTSYVNLAAYELYDLIIQKYGDNYYVANPFSITTDGTNDRFALPTDYYKLLAVDLQISSNQYINVPRFSIMDRNRYSGLGSNIQAAYGRSNLRYQINGSNIWLSPLPTSGQTLRLLYVPRLSNLVNDGDILDGVSGWEEYVIVDCAIRCLQKEESDVSILFSQKQALINRIESAAENRDLANPSTTVDVYSGNGTGGGPGYGGGGSGGLGGW